MLKGLRKSWARLGVRFDETFSTKGFVDLERLILETCHEGRKDSRLFFAMRGWLLKHYDLVNVSRLIRMVKKEKQTAMLGALMDSIVCEESRTYLRYVIKYCKPSPREEFAFEEIKGSKVICRLNKEENLPVWKRWNLISRDMGEAEGAVAEKEVVLKYNRNIALRALFGPKTRAEILSYLLQYKKGNARRIAETIGQSYEPVYSELKFCEDIGLVGSVVEGRATVYHVEPAFFKRTLKTLLAA